MITVVADIQQSHIWKKKTERGTYDLRRQIGRDNREFGSGQVDGLSRFDRWLAAEIPS